MLNQHPSSTSHSTVWQLLDGWFWEWLLYLYENVTHPLKENFWGLLFVTNNLLLLMEIVWDLMVGDWDAMFWGSLFLLIDTQNKYCNYDGNDNGNGNGNDNSNGNGNSDSMSLGISYPKQYLPSMDLSFSSPPKKLIREVDTQTHQFLLHQLLRRVMINIEILTSVDRSKQSKSIYWSRLAKKKRVLNQWPDHPT